MAVVMAFDYESWKERATFLYGLTLVVLVLLILLGVAEWPRPNLIRPRPVQRATG